MKLEYPTLLKDSGFLDSVTFSINTAARRTNDDFAPEKGQSMMVRAAIMSDYIIKEFKRTTRTDIYRVPDGVLDSAGIFDLHDQLTREEVLTLPNLSHLSTKYVQSGFFRYFLVEHCLLCFVNLTSETNFEHVDWSNLSETKKLLANISGDTFGHGHLFEVNEEVFPLPNCFPPLVSFSDILFVGFVLDRENHVRRIRVGRPGLSSQGNPTWLNNAYVDLENRALKRTTSPIVGETLPTTDLQSGNDLGLRIRNADRSTSGKENSKIRRNDNP